MKAIYSLLFILISSIGVHAQTVFDKFDGPDEIKSVIVNKKMFEMMSKVKSDEKDKDNIRYNQVLKKLEYLRVFTTENSKAANEIKQTTDGYLKSANLQELMRVNEGGKNVKIYMKPGSTPQALRELLMQIEQNNKVTLMSLVGNFTLEDISLIADKMNFPGSESLKRVTHK